MTAVSLLGMSPTNPNNSVMLQAAIDVGYRDFYFDECATYSFAHTVNLPQGVAIQFSGVGYGMTTLRMAPAAPAVLFKYFRPVGAPRATINFEKLVFVWGGTPVAAGSGAIDCQGANTSVHDSWLNISECMFYNFEVDVRVVNVSQNHFTRNWHALGRYSYMLGRGASFSYFDQVFSFSPYAIFARDEMDDAFSNGLFVDQCNFITAGGCNMFVRGWQAVFIDKSGFDLGSADAAALWFRNCQDVNVSQSFISSNGNGVRDGVLMDQSHTFVVRDCTIVNSRIGVNVIPPPAFSPSNGSIVGNTFDGNAINDVFLNPSCRGVKIKENHHKKQMSRTGSNYEIYANLPGVNNCHVIDNTLAGAPYPIVAGPNSVVRDNLFGVA